ncbi:hypothetical protein LY02_01558 [Nonlabens ulvanivorans]|uniref:Uncharacterized protein n=1 Tax=Nonlabens ulvanivorans TaxID=906888 RepID=A0ABX5E603_NONUL|nr:hypothetical protein LY02_01558 [Nonlabens ulvanivorans]
MSVFIVSCTLCRSYLRFRESELIKDPTFKPFDLFKVLVIKLSGPIFNEKYQILLRVYHVDYIEL